MAEGEVPLRLVLRAPVANVRSWDAIVAYGRSLAIVGVHIAPVAGSVAGQTGAKETLQLRPLLDRMRCAAGQPELTQPHNAPLACGCRSWPRPSRKRGQSGLSTAPALGPPRSL